MPTAKPRKTVSQDEHDDADDGDRRVLAVQISLRAFTDRTGDLLHTRISLVCSQDRLRRPDRIHDRKQPASDDSKKNHSRFL
jgi:hypothetical protein